MASKASSNRGRRLDPDVEVEDVRFMSVRPGVVLLLRYGALLVFYATTFACSDDAATGTSATATTGSGEPKTSVVHAELVCNGAVTPIDCIESQIGQRRVGANSASFDCYAEGARVVGEISEPRVGEVATFGSGFATIKATCATSPASQFDEELTVSNGTSGSVAITTYEAGVFMEGTFSDAAGSFSGSFSIYPETP
ncbi:MAG: hypothetical protein HOV80_20290 [Polyangiaceae bacterium]|nr:hypothetical protein [Polyangiaceae bacterium]